MMHPPAPGSNPPTERDRSGFRFLFETVAPSLLAWAALRVGRPLQARYDPEDILNEVCCRAYDRFLTFDPNLGSFRAWVFGIANNVLREVLSEHRRSPLRSAASVIEDGNLDAFLHDAVSVSQAVARNDDLRQFVVRVREQLDDDDKRLFVLRGLEQVPHGEIADLLQIPRKTIEKRWERLQRRMEALGLPGSLVAGG